MAKETIKIINEKCTKGNGKYSDKSLVLYAIEEIELQPTMYKMP